MTPSARLQAAIDILDGMGRSAASAERYLKEWFAARRFAGSGDRRAIGELVFRIQRHRGSLAWRMKSEEPRALVTAALLADGENPETLFTGGYGPAPLSAEEQAVIAAPPAPAPSWAMGEYPEWLEGELARRFGAALVPEMAAFAGRALVDLRVNTLKATRDDVLAALKTDGFEAEAIGVAAIRCPPATRNLDKHALYLSGAFEIQDLAAQTSVEQTPVKPGMRVLDMAAGAGGKSLALAVAMENKGEIVACDTRGAALAELEKRKLRAGAHIIRTHVLGRPPAGPFDLVFLDAPCSGSGTWRRQPELKWRLTPERVTELTNRQDRLLEQAAGFLGKEGAGTSMVYATCSILPSENEDRVAAFLAKNPDFRRAKGDFLASPAASGMDGFYAAFLTRI